MAISQSYWHDQNAWVLESETIRTVVVPDLGAKLVSLIDKRTQREWLVDPGDRPFKKVEYGANFVDQDMSGWDEMFPTIVACNYPVPGEEYGRALPDHGEVWPQSWFLEPAPENALRLSVEGRALHYRLTRTLSYSDIDTLQMHYELENKGRGRMPFIWAAHPQFDYGAEVEIVLPPQVKQVCNTIPPEWGWGEPETRFNWPVAVNVDGHKIRIDRAGPATLKQARKFFVVPETSVRWAGVIRQPAKDWLRFDWDPELVPYLAIWVDEGAINQASVIALEPTTGFYDSLAMAWERKQVTMIESEDTKSWTLSVRLGTGDDPFLMDDQLQ